MKIHQSVGALVDNGDKRAYIAAKSGFLKAVKVGAPDKPVHGYFIGKTDRPTSLEEVDPQVVLFNHVPVPAPIIAQATAIFRHVYKNYGGAEMIVFLRWKEMDLGNGRKIGRYYLDRADRVEVAAGGLDYVQNVPIVGSLHSHGSFGAGFSSTDDRWERDDTPGIYITIGNVNRDCPSIETSIGGLGVRKVIPSPIIPKEVFNSVTLSKETLAWWTETLTVKEYSRSTGFYICCGARVMGWALHENKAHLTTGEHIISVQQFHAEAKKKEETWKRTSWSKPLKFDRKANRVLTAATVGTGSLNLNEYRRISNFIKFLKKKNAFSDFMYLMLNQVNGAEGDNIVYAVDQYCAEEKEEEIGDNLCGNLPFSGAEGLGTTWPKPWDGSWQE